MHEPVIIGNATLYLGYCMEAMAQMPDNAFDLAIVDPPYGINIGQTVGGGKPFGSKGDSRRQRIIQPKVYRGFDDSQIPSKSYFSEVRRVSKNQIIWGGNYFVEHLANSPCWIVWDKDNSGNFADCELAWTSFNTAVRKFQFRWNGMLQQDMKHKEERNHPTQKPVRLYSWLLEQYAKTGDNILDTHHGSGSNAIACLEMGFNITAYEIDEEYFNSSVKRIEAAQQQQNLFTPAAPKFTWRQAELMKGELFNAA